MTAIIALDTETTGLDPDTEDVFEVAMIDLDTDREQVVCLMPRPEVVEAMHPKAAEVNRYHERRAAGELRFVAPDVGMETIREMLDGAHIIGAVPDFDTRFLTALFGRRFAALVDTPRWHYHLIDIEAMAVGWLHGRSHEASEQFKARTPLLTATRPDIDLPWRSDDLSRACGIEPPSDAERHTALGDARWVARWYRALTDSAHPSDT